jgi:hypothetical protein
MEGFPENGNVLLRSPVQGARLDRLQVLPRITWQCEVRRRPLILTLGVL